MLFDFFQYIHPAPIKIGVAEKKIALPGPGEQNNCFLALDSSLNVLLHFSSILVGLHFYKLVE